MIGVWSNCGRKRPASSRGPLRNTGTFWNVVTALGMCAQNLLWSYTICLIRHPTISVLDSIAPHPRPLKLCLCVRSVSQLGSQVEDLQKELDQCREATCAQEMRAKHLNLVLEHQHRELEQREAEACFIPPFRLCCLAHVLSSNVCCNLCVLVSPSSHEVHLYQTEVAELHEIQVADKAVLTAQVQLC